MSQVAELTEISQGVQSSPRLQDHVKTHLERYFSELGNAAPGSVYNLVLQEVEKPMFEMVLQYMRYNQSKTAAVLGISRGTLRKKMKFYGLLKADD